MLTKTEAMFKNFDSKFFSKRLLLLVAVFLISGITIAAPYFIFEKIYEQKIYPGIYLGNYHIGGMTTDELRKFINTKYDELNKNGLIYSYKGERIVISPTIALLSGEAAYEVIIFNTDKTIDSAYMIGRSKNLSKNIINKISALIKNKKIALSYAINNEDILNTLTENYNQYEIEAKNAELKVKNATNTISFDISDEQSGVAIDYTQGLYKMADQLSRLDFSPVKLTSKNQKPTILKKDCAHITTEAENIIKKSPITLSLKIANEASSTDSTIKTDKTWEVSKKVLADWLTINNNNNVAIIDLDKNKVFHYVTAEIASSTDREPIDAKFEIVDGKVTEFQPSQDGLKIQLDDSFTQLKEDIIKKTATSSFVILDKVKSKLNTEDVNDLGIKEIIGTGHSNFSGSPANRRHNIKVGTNKLNGLVIKSDEEFSLVKALGSVEAADGYLPELVIKGNKTIPEYGGGLCQVATTLFRVALQSGLPITARRNHAYRVSYYEPAGMDAAVYMPWPDVRFINDTGKNILIQIRFEGNDLYFDFWGVKDGREITVTDPVIYNIVGAGPTKIVETTELAPGQKKCTESAHAGADAYFDYTVTMPNGEKKEERFSSHYVPWQAVCLIGIDEKSKEEDGSTTEKSEAGNTDQGEAGESIEQKPENKKVTPESLGIIFEE